jgi:hypothetical protein
LERIFRGGQLVLRSYLAKDIPYSGTKIDVDDTKADISRMLKEFGAKAIRWTETNNALPLLEFLVDSEINGVQKEIGIRIQAPNIIIKKRVGGRYGNIVNTSAPEQSMRLLFWYIKSRLEAVKFGLESIEKTFLSKVIMQLSDGSTTTVGEAVSKQLSLDVQSNKLLPEFEIKNEVSGSVR